MTQYPDPASAGEVNNTVEQQVMLVQGGQQPR